MGKCTTRKPALSLWIVLATLLLLALLQLALAVVPALAANDYYLRNAIVEDVERQLGKPYEWGAVGPNSFDCSGLVYYCFRTLNGVPVPRVANDQYNYCSSHPTKSTSSMYPADLVFAYRTNGVWGHVGIYVGGGKVIEAPGTGDVVKYSDLSNTKWTGTGRCLGDYIPPTTTTWYDPIASGDFDGDKSAAGFDRCDVGLFIKGTNGGGTGRRINVLRSTGSNPMDMQMNWYDDGTDNWSTSKTTAGDYNADGKCDYALFCKNREGGAAGRRVLVFLSSGSSFTKQQWFEDDTDSFDTTQIASGNFDGDTTNGIGRSDIALFIKNQTTGKAGRRILVLKSTGSISAGGFTKETWFNDSNATYDTTRLTAGDYTGDAKCDIGLLIKNQNGGAAGKRVTVLKSLGSVSAGGFNSAWIWNSAADNWSTVKVVSGNFNGDKSASGFDRCDIALVSKYTNGGGEGKRVTPLISSGSSFDWQLWWQNSVDNWDNLKVTAGDYNGDGYCDVGLYLKNANGGTAGRRFVMLKSEMPTSKSFVDNLWYNSDVANWDITK